MLWRFFLSSLAIGCLTFGGGYAMVSALQRELVVRHGWLTPGEFSSGVAVGQVTPGPLMVMVAFMGYKIAGAWGALLGTVALFAPSFVLVLLLARSFDRVRANPRVAAALRGVNAAVVGLLLAATLDLGRASLTAATPTLLALAAFVLILGPFRRQPTWVLVAAGLLGVVLLR